MSAAKMLCAALLSVFVIIAACNAHNFLTVSQALEHTPEGEVALEACLYSSRSSSSLRDCDGLKGSIQFIISESVSVSGRKKFVQAQSSAWSPFPSQQYAAHVKVVGQFETIYSPHKIRIFRINKVLSVRSE